MTSFSGEINFQTSVEENDNVLALQQELNSALSTAVAGVTDSVQSLEKYNFLWNTDPNTYLHNFLHYTWYITPYLLINFYVLIRLVLLQLFRTRFTK